MGKKKLKKTNCTRNLTAYCYIQKKTKKKSVPDWKLKTGQSVIAGFIVYNLTILIYHPGVGDEFHR